MLLDIGLIDDTQTMPSYGIPMSRDATALTNGGEQHQSCTPLISPALSPTHLAVVQDWRAVEPSLCRLMESAKSLSKKYQSHYFRAKSNQKYFDIPIIVISSMNGVFIAGGSVIMSGNIVHVLTCVLALLVGVIQGVKTLYKIDETREGCLTTYRDLHRIYCDICVMLDRPRSSRKADPNIFSETIMSQYMKATEKAVVIRDKTDPVFADLKAYDE